jgi:hypothetical protein
MSASTAMPFEGIIQSAKYTAAPNASGLRRAVQQAGGKGKASWAVEIREEEGQEIKGKRR